MFKKISANNAKINDTIGSISYKPIIMLIVKSKTNNTFLMNVISAAWNDAIPLTVLVIKPEKAILSNSSMVSILAYMSKSFSRMS
jgi:hypothetical protein